MLILRSRTCIPIPVALFATSVFLHVINLVFSRISNIWPHINQFSALSKLVSYPQTFRGKIHVIANILSFVQTPRYTPLFCILPCHFCVFSKYSFIYGNPLINRTICLPHGLDNQGCTVNTICNGNGAQLNILESVIMINTSNSMDIKSSSTKYICVYY